ncbi:MAG TPA: hypothetical protein VID93_11275 [Acidimicrobiales bacterium]
MLPALWALPVQASSDSDAWLSAREVQMTHATAIGAAAKDLADGADEPELAELRLLVASAVVAFDGLEVRDCFRVWWSYVRTSYVLYDQALAGLEAHDGMRVQAATAASMYLTTMAANTAVDCPRTESGLASRSESVPSGGLPTVLPPDFG